MKSIGIFVGGYYHPWDENNVKHGMGGSETWAIELAKEFSYAGYDVTVFAMPETDHDICENCHLVHYNKYFENLRDLEFDFFIFSRVTGPISPYLKCKNVYLMAHDVVFITDQNTPYNIGQGKVKAYCYLSEWHKQNLLEIYNCAGLTGNVLYPVTNGYSKNFYENIELDKKENCMIWSSAIVRGFDLFYKWVFLPVLMRYPDFKLYICGYAAIPEEQQIHENCKLLPGVEVLGKLSKEELAEYQKKSKIWVYPGTFPETFCITAVENAAAGNVIIAPLSYGLGSTLQNIPYLKETNLPILSKDTAHLYINSICNVLENKEMYKECQRQCLQLSNIYSWKRTAEEFINLFNQSEQ